MHITHFNNDTLSVLATQRVIDIHNNLYLESYCKEVL